MSNPETLFSFSNESETIVKFIIEKLISLVISTSDNSIIYKKVPDYCFERLKRTLISFCELKYMTYDRDDGPIPQEKKFNPSKSLNENLDISKLSEFKNSILDKSLHLNKTLLEKKTNGSFLNFSKDNIFEKNKIENKEKIPFKDNNIGKINKIEIQSNNDSKIENSLISIEYENDETNNKFYNNYYPGKNFWEILPQPKAIITDRNASTMIRFNKNVIVKKEKKINKENKENSVKKRKKKEKKTSLEKEKEEKVDLKKPKILFLPIESHDIPIEQFPNLMEGEEVNILREERKNEINLKRIEELKRIQKEEERLQKEREKQDKLRDVQMKQITVDINGNIVHIKPLNMDQLISEFTSATSNQREIDKIKGEEPINTNTKITIEKNPNTSGIIQDISLKKTKEKKNLFSAKKKNNNNSSILKKSTEENNNNNNNNNKQNNQRGSLLSNDNSLPKLNLKPKSNSQFAAGSNFDIMNPECGVILKENSKYKTGGMDFFKKYNRYSIENFETQQNKTQTENFYKNRNEDIMDNLIKNDYNLKEISPKTQQDFHKNHLNLEPSEMNNTLHLKTKNLKKALNDLDLISESLEKEKIVYTRNKPGELFHKKKNNSENYEDMNTFAKTLMGRENWGNAVLNHGKNKYYYMPKINKDKNNGINTTRLRRKIPPLNINYNNFGRENNNNKMSITSTSGFFKIGKKGKKPIKLPKLKEEDFIDAIEKDEENEKKGFVTTNHFYKEK